MLGRGLEVERERENVCSTQTEGSYWLKGTVKLKDSCFESKISLDPEDTHNCSPGVRYNNNTGFGMGMLTVDLKNRFIFIYLIFPPFTSLFVYMQLSNCCFCYSLSNLFWEHPSFWLQWPFCEIKVRYFF